MSKKDCFSYGGIELSVLNQADPLVPDKADEISLTPGDKKALALAVKNDLSTLLIGETGTGKTSAIRYLAHLRIQGYTRINMHGYNTPDELIGSKSVKNGSTYHENGVLINAMLKGHICVLDEINATPPDCMFIIHGLMDEDKRITLPNGDVIRPHPDFRLFATMNPDYEGTHSLNRAFIDRFAVILCFEVLGPEKEQELLTKRIGIEPELAEKMVRTAWLGRQAYKDQKTLTLISTRTLLQWAKLVKEGLDEKVAYIKSVVNKARQEEQTAFADFYNAVFKVDPNNSEAALDAPFLTTVRKNKALEENISRLEKDIRKFQKERDDATDLSSKTELEVEALKEKIKAHEDSKKELGQLQEKLKEYEEKQKVLQANLEKIKQIPELIESLKGLSESTHAPAVAEPPEKLESGTGSSASSENTAQKSREFQVGDRVVARLDAPDEIKHFRGDVLAVESTTGCVRIKLDQTGEEVVVNGGQFTNLGFNEPL